MLYEYHTDRSYVPRPSRWHSCWASNCSMVAHPYVAMRVLLLLGLLGPAAVRANKTATWLEKRDKLIGSVYGQGDGVLPTRSVPDETLTYPSDPTPGLQGLVWNISNGLFPITSTVFYAPASGDPKKRSKSAFMFHHGHSDCVCAPPPGGEYRRDCLDFSQSSAGTFF